jgi:co-chaperonin GroES (HSP10)
MGDTVTWTPLHDKIIVLRDKPKETYDGDANLAVAEQHQHAQNKGVVLVIGTGRVVGGYEVPLKVAPGMEVLFGQHSGTDLEEDPSLLILREDELLGFRWPAKAEEPAA